MPSKILVKSDTKSLVRGRWRSIYISTKTGDHYVRFHGELVPMTKLAEQDFAKHAQDQKRSYRKSQR